MKKALSIILAVVMIATLLPSAVFATEGESGYTITYDLSSDLNRLGLKFNTTTPLQTLSYENTNYVYEYFKAKIGATDNEIDKDNIKYVYFNTTNDSTDARKDAIALKRLNYIAFKINVPAKAEYDVKIHRILTTGSSYTGDVNVYISQGSESTDSLDYIGTYNCQTTPDTGLDNTSEFISLGKRELDAGEHIITFYNATSEYSYGIVSSFSLVSGDGSGKVLAHIDTSIDSTALNLESFKNAQISVDAMYLSDASKVEDTSVYEVIYDSNNKNVAMVDETGKITAVGAGDAVITVCATDSYGAIAKSTHTVSVTEHGYKILYNLSSDMARLNLKYGQNTPIQTLSYINTNDFYEYFGASFTPAEDKIDNINIKYEYIGSGTSKTEYIKLGKNSYLAFEINVPVRGYYDLEINKVFMTSTSYNNNMNVYISESAASTNTDDLIGIYNSYNSELNKTAEFIRLGTRYFEAGKYIVTFHNTGSSNYGIISSFALVSGTNDALMGGKISSTASSINVDENETATVKATGYLSSTAQATTAFTYTSSDTAVATVNEETGVVTPVKEGKVTITATATDAEIANTLTTDITITCNKPGEVVADTKVNFKASAYEGGSVSDTRVQEVTIGTDVTVTATPDTGYTFAYWKNSAGVVLSTNAIETFKVSTNMGVIAVFDETPTDDAIPVYFYNGNGVPLGNASVAKNTTFAVAKEAAEVPETPSLTGFVFKHWSDKNEETPILDTDTITALTRAVAIYEDANTTYTVTVGTEAVETGKKYGDPVTVNGSDNFSCWMLGDKVMSYEKNYTFNVYGNITLTEVTEGDADKAPVLVLDKVGGNYFLTYDEADYELVEAGILFGSENVTIESIDGYKASAKKGTGQFTAQPHKDADDDTIARGYMIIQDVEDNVRVIYAD